MGEDEPRDMTFDTIPTRRQWIERTSEELAHTYGEMGKWQQSSDRELRPWGNIPDHPPTAERPSWRPSRPGALDAMYLRAGGPLSVLFDATARAAQEQQGLRMMGALEEQQIEDLRRDAAKWNVRVSEERDTVEQTQVVGWGPGEAGMLRCGWCTRFKGQLHADDCGRPRAEQTSKIEQPDFGQQYTRQEAPMAEPGDFSQHQTFTADVAKDLPERVVVGANGAYWRDYGDHYSMCPVSEDNDPVVPIAVYVPESTTGADRTDAEIERSARVSELSMLLDFIEGDPIDGVPKRKAIEQAVKYRILGLMKDDPEPIDADPGREPIELPRIFPPGMADEDLIALTEKRVRLEIATKLAIWITELVGD